MFVQDFGMQFTLLKTTLKQQILKMFSFWSMVIQINVLMNLLNLHQNFIMIFQLVNIIN